MKTTVEIVSLISDYVNNLNCDEEEFAQGMGQLHRTLQQTFTRLCIAWLKHLATVEYYDARNEASVMFAKSIKEQLDNTILPMV